MKYNYTTFRCDECGEEIRKKEGHGYPYEKGWRYIYNFGFKFSNKEQKIADVHLCSNDCFNSFMTTIMKDLGLKDEDNTYIQLPIKVSKKKTIKSTKEVKQK